MDLKTVGIVTPRRKKLLTQSKLKTAFLAMKITAFILFVACLQVSAKTYSQRISIVDKDAPLIRIFGEIKKQTGYTFAYTESLLTGANKVTINVTNGSLDEVLDICFKAQPFTYTIIDKTIVLKPKIEKAVSNNIAGEGFTSIDVHGKIMNEKGEPVAGVLIAIKGGKPIGVTNDNGEFTLKNVPANAILVFSAVTIEAFETRLNGRTELAFNAKTKVSVLDEVQMIAYGSTSKRLNTGSVSTVKGEDINKQPVSNPLAALSGRVPGLEVTQASGVPGSSFTLQIRGRNSIAQGSQPLILIDGIPFSSGNEQVNELLSAVANGNTKSGLSAFNTINPSDIESIDVLKDADATAIYGSRGANGVILITTRKGKIGSTRVTANFNEGITKVGATMPLLNTQQYIAMRQEAFTNSNVIPDANNAPDLKVWDPSSFKDLKKDLIGNNGVLTNAQLSLSGGTSALQFLLGGSYYREKNIYPGQETNQRGSMNINLSHSSINKRFNANFSASFTSATNNSPAVDLTYYTFLSPNTPSFFDENGKLKWSEGGVAYDNPYSFNFNTYTVNTDNLMSSLTLSYRLAKSVTFKTALGYNQQNTREIELYPKVAQSPLVSQISSSQFGTNQYKGWNIEPQLEYKASIWKGKFNMLFGSTFQERTNAASYLYLSGFSSDALLQSQQAASVVNAKNNINSVYHYQAFFGRVNYNIADKYLLNFTARRDGSSRFGPSNQFANFGAIGAAWIFSEESFIKDNLADLSYAKLHSSFGVTGNDQIGDYKYLDAWGAYSATYQSTGTLVPLNLYNTDYSWEKNRKLEIALDLGFFEDRLLFSANYYRNRSSNQLILYKLPYLTGFASITENFPAEIENRGWELQLSNQVINNHNFKWISSFNITIPKNTLVNFPGIETSTYATTYVVGQSINSIYNYQSLGVNPTTGLYTFKDTDGSGTLNAKDYLNNGNLDPKYFGGLRNTFSLKNFELDFFLDFRKQMGKNYLYSIYSQGQVPGMLLNQPTAVLDRWQKVGDISKVEKFVSTPNSTSATTLNSSEVYSDQSFLRLKTLSFSYSLSENSLSKIKAKQAKLYIQAQNLITLNRDKGYNPETQYLYSLPPLKVYTIGIQITY